MVELPRTREAAGGEANALLARLRRGALRALAARPLYRHSLVGRVPEDLRRRMGERWPGDTKRGAAILAGEIEFAGELVRNPAPAWFPSSAGPEWLASWHGFGWLADLVSAGDEAREAARALIHSWLGESAAWHPIGRRSDGLATRGLARVPHRGARGGAGRDRAHGADAAVFSPWRPPPRAVQQFDRGGWRPR